MCPNDFHFHSERDDRSTVHLYCRQRGPHQEWVLPNPLSPRDSCSDGPTATSRWQQLVQQHRRLACIFLRTNKIKNRQEREQVFSASPTQNHSLKRRGTHGTCSKDLPEAWLELETRPAGPQTLSRRVLVVQWRRRSASDDALSPGKPSMNMKSFRNKRSPTSIEIQQLYDLWLWWR